MPGKTLTSISKLELRTAYGPVFRNVLDSPPRPCTAEEILIIDLKPLRSDNLEERRALAKEIRAASINSGFFYIQNHGVDDKTIADAKKQLLAFFKQPKSKYFNGYKPARTSNINVGESVDVKESLGWRYDPKYDPRYKDPAAVPEDVKPYIRGEDFASGRKMHTCLDLRTKYLPSRYQTLTHLSWAACLTLARKLVKIFALSLDLEQTYFDSKTTYPGSDGVFNYYPPRTEEEIRNNFVGLGSHTDLQLFTLLWLDMTGGLQVLNKDGQWIIATPIEGTIVVNIGDFMIRLCNDTYILRVSMPFFFGIKFNSVEGVIPSCTSEANPAKYEPISCGDWCQLRFKGEEEESRGKIAALKAQAPSAVVVAA
ncbi:hypothetical protein BJ878DRAFT_579715 [Calycina marina]|uniref:Fe2OG dioxygenase domain-containing protein n=1 Tax=Calycina marina TaxID=1763456 RepID=A0A9P7ZC16_9HELO|nr:hypothetical protein BJ878DRAFT_579715 [Calycina marina]